MRLYKVNNDNDLLSCDQIIDRYFDDPSDFENTDRADESLDETYESYTIQGRTFSPSEILYNCDESSYNDFVYEDAENELEYIKEELVSELENLDEDESYYQNGYTFTFVYDDDDTDDEDDDTDETLCNLIA